MGAGLLRERWAWACSAARATVDARAHVAVARPRSRRKALGAPVRASRPSPCRRTAGPIAFTGMRSGKAALYVRSLDRRGGLGPGRQRRRRKPVLLAGRPLRRLRGRRRAQEGLGGGRSGDDDGRSRREERGLGDGAPSGRRHLRRVVGRGRPHRRRPLLGRPLRGERVRRRAAPPHEGRGPRLRPPPSPGPPGRRAILFTRCAHAGRRVRRRGPHRRAKSASSSSRPPTAATCPPATSSFFREGVLARRGLRPRRAPALRARRRRPRGRHAGGRAAAPPLATAGPPSSPGRLPASLALARGGAQPLSSSSPSASIGAARRPRWACATATTRGRGLSPDGGRIAVTHTSEGRRERTRIWVVDARARALSPLPGEGFSSAVWSTTASGCSSGA